MKINLVTHLCFLVPFVLVTFNVQVFTTILVSSTIAQLIAYGNIALLLLGIALIIKKRGELSKTVKLLITFFLMYFSFAILASAIHHNPANILFSIVPFVYLLAFYVYLSIPGNRIIFKKVALVTLVLSTILAIHLYNINFDIEVRGTAKYKVDRAQGVFGDANNTAVSAIIAFIFLYKLYTPEKYIFKLVKLLFLGLVFYTLFLTFSTTGFLVFIIAFVILNYKFFTGIKLILAIVILPVFYITLINLNNLTANLDLRGQQREKITNLVNVLTFNTEEVDDSGRNELVTKLLNDYVFENPILGNGLDFAISKRAHNTVVGVWADAGIFTFLFFLFMLFKYFINTINSPPSIRYFVLPLLICICIFMLSLQSVINQPYLITLLVYLGYLVDMKNEDELLFKQLDKTLEEPVSIKGL